MSFFEPAEFHEQPGVMGFRGIEDRPGTDIVCQYLVIARTALAARGTHVLHANTCSAVA